MAQDLSNTPLPSDIRAHWSSADGSTYAQIAGHLLELAGHAKSPEVRDQFAQLAMLYQRLAGQRAQAMHQYRPTAD